MKEDFVYESVRPEKVVVLYYDDYTVAFRLCGQDKKPVRTMDRATFELFFQECDDDVDFQDKLAIKTAKNQIYIPEDQHIPFQQQLQQLYSPFHK